ncbi:Uncharacterised protein [Enterobacter cloacae]|nr:Uncharacterised protein [Enterobacter cloacae]
MNLTVDVGDIRFSDVVVSNDRGEGKEEQRDGNKIITEARHHTFHCRLDISRSCGHACYSGIERCAVDALHVIQPGDQQHKPGRGADKQRVDVHGERLNQPLFHRMAYGRRRGGMWPGTLRRLVGIDATLHAPHDGLAQNSAKPSFKAKSTFPDQQYN